MDFSSELTRDGGLRQTSHGIWQHLAHPGPQPLLTIIWHTSNRAFNNKIPGFECLVWSLPPFRQIMFWEGYAGSFNPFPATWMPFIRCQEQSTFHLLYRMLCKLLLEFQFLKNSWKQQKSSQNSISGTLNFFLKLFSEGNCTKCIFVGSERVNDKSWLIQAKPLGGMHNGELSSFGLWPACLLPQRAAEVLK